MNNYLNIKANKKYLPTKNIQKENIPPNKKPLNKLKRISPNEKKQKQINNYKENQEKNILTDIVNLTLKNDKNNIKNQKTVKNSIINRIKKVNPKDLKKVQITKNNCNNILKLQKKVIHQNKKQKKNLSSLPLFENYIEKALSTKNTNNKIDRNKTKVLRAQRTFSIYDQNKTFTNNYSKRNSVILNANYCTDGNFNQKNRVKSADVSANKIKEFIKKKKNIKKEDDNMKNNSVIIRHSKKTRGVIKLSINNYFNKNEDNKKIKLDNGKNVIFCYSKNKNPQIVEEYFDEIYKYLITIENIDLPKENYMKNVQKDITEKMRKVLVDWLIDVHVKFKLFPETLFLTINIIDRYLSKKAINRKHLQLLGITALFISSKYEDIYPPDLKEFLFMTDNSYKKEQLIKLENDILDKIEFCLTYPTSLRFLEIYKKLFNLKTIDFYRCRYFIEISLLDYNCSHFSPSLIALTSIFLNWVIKNPKCKDMKYFENKILNVIEYDSKKINPCLNCLVTAIKQIIESNKYSSIKRKYEKEQYMKVSKEKINLTHIIENMKINN